MTSAAQLRNDLSVEKWLLNSLLILRKYLAQKNYVATQKCTLIEVPMYYLYLRTLLVMAQIATLLPSILKIQSPFRYCKTGLRAICGCLQSFIKLEINFKTKLVTAQIIVKLNCGVMRRAGQHKTVTRLTYKWHLNANQRTKRMMLMDCLFGGYILLDE